MIVAVVLASGVTHASGSSLGARGAMPAVPPPHVRFPDGFDEEGCALLASGDTSPRRVCPAAAPAIAVDWARYLGYEGPAADASERSGAIVLLPETVTVASRGWWRAAGLVRNDTGSSVREIRVTVELATTGERVLGRATVVVPVRDVRPGEPAPFEVRTLVPVQSVRRVTWSTSFATGADPSSRSRMAEIEVGRIAPLPVVGPIPSDIALSAAADPANAPATIGWGILRNWGPLPIARATIVGMWLDERGRAVRLVEGRVLEASRGGRTFTPDLLPGATWKFELFERDASSLHGAGWRLALWQSTS